MMLKTKKTQKLRNPIAVNVVNAVGLIWAKMKSLARQVSSLASNAWTYVCERRYRAAQGANFDWKYICGISVAIISALCRYTS